MKKKNDDSLVLVRDTIRQILFDKNAPLFFHQIGLRTLRVILDESTGFWSNAGNQKTVKKKSIYLNE